MYGCNKKLFVVHRILKKTAYVIIIIFAAKTKN